MGPFKAHEVIEERMRDQVLCSYLVGFDINDTGVSYYRMDPLIMKIFRPCMSSLMGSTKGSRQITHKHYLK